MDAGLMCRYYGLKPSCNAKGTGTSTFMDPKPSLGSSERGSGEAVLRPAGSGV